MRFSESHKLHNVVTIKQNVWPELQTFIVFIFLLICMGHAICWKTFRVWNTLQMIHCLCTISINYILQNLFPAIELHSKKTTSFALTFRSIVTKSIKADLTEEFLYCVCIMIHIKLTHYSFFWKLLFNL